MSVLFIISRSMTPTFFVTLDSTVFEKPKHANGPSGLTANQQPTQTISIQQVSPTPSSTGSFEEEDLSEGSSIKEEFV